MATVFCRTTRDLVEVCGPDAIGWLQGQISQDVAGLPVGGVTRTFLLSPRGKVDGWGRIRRTADDAVRIDVDPGAGDAWRERLERFKLRTDATVTVHPGVSIVAVRGSEPDGALPAGWPGIEGGDLLPDPDAADPTDDTWIESAVVSLRAAGATEIDEDALDILRIRSGVPVSGVEFDEDTIPATLGSWVIDASVAFTKGCYTGQELVVRIHSRGGNVPRRLVGLTADRTDSIVEGAPVLVDGTERGLVTSVAHDDGSIVALAHLQRSVEVPAPAVVGDVDVELHDLPLR